MGGSYAGSARVLLAVSQEEKTKLARTASAAVETRLGVRDVNGIAGELLTVIHNRRQAHFIKFFATD
jgi:hypothetical protein